MQAPCPLGVMNCRADHKAGAAALPLEADTAVVGHRVNSARSVKLAVLRAVQFPPTFMTGDSGGRAEGIAIMVRKRAIRLKFFCEISSSPSM